MKYFKISYPQLKTELLSGLTIATALVPEAISFALLVGVSPQAGLWAAFFMAMSTALFGGRPGVISGATGATAVILAALVSLHGEDLLYLGVLMAGVIQLLIWLTKGWKLFQFIPKDVINGFLTALAILIFTSQLKYLAIGNPNEFKYFALIIVILLSALAMWLSSKYFKFPPAIAAITVGSILGWSFGLAQVGDLSQISNSVPSWSFPTITWAGILTVLPYSFGMAFSGLTESLITVDEVSNKLGRVGKRDPKEKETLAQAIGNIISSQFSAIGGCVLVGQTNLNVAAGAKYRLSAITASLGLLLIILLFGKWIELLPLAGLIGVMLIVVYQTGAWSAFKSKNWKTLTVFFSTIIVSLVTHNLAIGVISGTLIHYLLQKIAK